MNALLVRPPFYSVFGTETKVGNIPLGLCYISEAIEQAGHNVEILDCETLKLGDRADAGEMSYTNELNISYSKYAEVMGNGEHPVWREIAEAILRKDADMIGFTAQTATMSPVIYISKILKKSSDVKIVLGGVHVTALPSLSLKETYADVAVIGEGEKTMLELADGNNIKTIKGIAYRKDSWIRVNEPRPRIDNLDSIPFPARHLLDRRSYKDTAFGYMISSRGCPFECCFCASKTIWGRKTRFRSSENVLDEIEEIAEYTNLIRFTDDTFTLNKKKALNFCEALKRRNLEISFRCGGRTDCVDEELLKALKSVNCRNISFGVESGSQRILDLIGKQTTVKAAKKALGMAKDAGLETIAFFIVGHPTETLQDIQATMKLIEDLDAFRTSVSIMTPYPGTTLFKPYLGYDWWKYYHQGRTVKSLSALSDEKLNEVYTAINQWVTNRNIGIKEPMPEL